MERRWRIITLLVVFILLRTSPGTTEENCCTTSQVSITFKNIANLLRPRSLLVVHNNVHSFNTFKWPLYVKVSSLNLASNKTVPGILTNLFDVLLIWVSAPREINEAILRLPFVVKNRVVVILLDKTQFHMINTILEIQEHITWRQNRIIIFEFNNSSCKNFNLLTMKHAVQRNSIIIENRQYFDNSENEMTETISLQTQNITVGILTYEPDAIKTHDFNNGTWLFKGFVYDLLAYYLCPTLNLRMIEIYGNQLPTDDFDAVYEMISKNELGTSTTNYVMTSDKVDFVDCASLDLKFDYLAVAITQTSGVKNFMWFTYTKGITTESWGVITLAWLLQSFLLPVIINVVPEYQSTKRILRFVQSLFMFFVISAFNAVLYASLTVMPIKNTYESLQDLIQDGNFKFIAQRGSDVHNIVARAKSAAELIKLNELFLHSPNEGAVPSSDEALMQVTQGSYAFVHYLDLFKNDLQNDCRFQIIQTQFKILLHLLFAKKSKYTELFSQKVILLKEFGLLTQVQKMYTPEFHCDGNKNNLQVRACTLYHTITAFVVLMLGINFSLIAGFIEAFYGMRYN